jgi:hypothetical protein
MHGWVKSSVYTTIARIRAIDLLAAGECVYIYMYVCMMIVYMIIVYMVNE